MTPMTLTTLTFMYGKISSPPFPRPFLLLRLLSDLDPLPPFGMVVGVCTSSLAERLTTLASHSSQENFLVFLVLYSGFAALLLPRLMNIVSANIFINGSLQGVALHPFESDSRLIRFTKNIMSVRDTYTQFSGV